MCGSRHSCALIAVRDRAIRIRSTDHNYHHWGASELFVLAMLLLTIRYVAVVSTPGKVGLFEHQAEGVLGVALQDEEPRRSTASVIGNNDRRVEDGAEALPGPGPGWASTLTERAGTRSL